MAWTIWTTVAVTVSLASALTAPTLVSQPIFDLDDLGRVGLAGNFDGISLYEYTGQTQSAPFTNGSQSLLTQLPNGLFSSLGLADEAINAMCVYELSDGTQRGVVVGGNFTSLGGIEAKGIALYNPDDDSITTLGDFQGRVSALLCDKGTSRVYVGGMFSMNQSENAAAWEDGEWKNLPFEGFTGPVNTVTRSNNNTILFGGNFDGLRNFSAPTIRDAQTLNIVSAEITAEQTSDLAGFNDPAAITCTNGTETQWLVRDGQRGSWTAAFRFEFFPTKLRLINSDFEDRSTETFRLTAFPLGGIMNLTYTDSTGNEQHCAETCPLAAIDEAQDFEFIDVVGMKSFRIDILSHRGAGGGLSSVQLFQDNIFTFAIPELNEPSCTAADVPRSASIASGAWFETEMSAVGSSNYLSVDVDASTIPSTSVVFEPHIEQSGRYQILIFTPGCVQDGSCATRGRTSATGTVTSNGNTVNLQFAQTNDFDKYDVAYEGDVDVASGSFRPRITLAPTPNQPADTVRIVAQRVQFKLISENKQGETPSGTSTGSSGLNGIYEYDPQATGTTDPADSRINAAGLRLNDNASIATIVVKGDFTYVGGNLTTGDFQHFFIIDKNNDALPSVPEGGLDDAVNIMHASGDLIYVGGAFSGTRDDTIKGVTGIGAYDTAQNSWVALGAGVNGVVSDIVPISLNLTSGVEECIAISGDFSAVRPDTDAANAVEVEGFAVWIPSTKQWLEATDGVISLSGILSAVVTADNIPIYAGSMASNTMVSSGAVYLLDSDVSRNTLAPSALEMVTTRDTASRKRDVSPQNVTGVVTGLFYVDNGKNLTILGGNFEAQGQNDTTIRNLAIIDGNNNDAVDGATDEFASGSTILAMQVLDKLLFVGGSLEGTTNGTIGGIAIWDLDQMALAATQPQPLNGDNVTVLDITRRPDTNDIYVAGEFATAGSLDCANLCIYQNDAQRWVDASPEVPGRINTMRWVDQDHLLVAGDMNLNGTAMYLALYDTQLGIYKAVDADASNIPGPVTSIAVDSDTSDTLFIAGTATNGTSPYLMKLKNKKFVALQAQFEEDATIHNIQVLNLQSRSTHDDNDFLQGEHILLITGDLKVSGFGNASAVTYDGKDWKPFMLTSKSNGDPGTITTFFSQIEPVFSKRKSRLARGYVILISLAIALALVFLLVVGGVIASRIRRAREGYVPMPTMSGAEKSAQMQGRLPPQDFLQDVGAGRGRGPPMI
ncbi:cortical protein marker for cell polarity-domain-containing protein [Tricharina praecox]|uniref:cortical protein marker for cell polarity-domain-containing protein n=1 Tax=Tricharina praecox TaxID=43433 RepID=UPI0022210D85|nr:cortical protein marker for cell polarity-domain-containing protein [Tricharina praecox]KAI5846947.1 cortical protein marker for cell polarity-domain-containing protein [Tricharina praecox]